MIRQRFLRHATIMFALQAALLIGCGDDNGGGGGGDNPPTITTHPSNQTVTVGEIATFTVAATGSGTLTYQWKKGGVNVAGGTGATSASYTTPATILADNGVQFTCVVTNAAGSVTSNAATLTVNPPPDAEDPTISISSPSSSPWATSQTSISISGAAGDNVGVTSVTWSSDRGGSGTATGTTSWSISSAGLLEGNNVITVTAHDAAGNTASATTTIVCTVVNTPPTAQVSTPSSPDGGDILISYTLADTEGDSCDVYVEYSLDGSTFFPAAQGAGGDATTSLATSDVGIDYFFSWDSVANGVGISAQEDAYIRITPSQGGIQGTSDTTSAFTVDNIPNQMPSASVTTPGGSSNGNIAISYSLSDAESDTLNVAVQFSADAGVTFSTATQAGGDPLTGLSSSPGGTLHTFVWNSAQDIGYVNSGDIRIQVIPTDSRAGTPGVTNCFIVENNPYEGTITPIVTDPDSQWRPKISGTIVVYEEEMISQVYKADISGASPVVTAVTSTGYNDRPDVAGGRIFWVEDGAPDTLKWTPTTGGAISNVSSTAGNQRSPRGDGNRVVMYRLYSGTFYITVHDFSDGSDTDISSAYQEDRVFPVICGDIVAWIDERSGAGYDIYMYDLANPSDGEVRVTASPTAVRGCHVATNGSVVVWNDTRGELYAYDVSSLMEYSLGVSGQELNMDGDRVVYSRGGNIYLYDLVLAHEFPIAEPADTCWLPDISGDWVVWEQETATGDDIYGYHIGGAGFSVNTPPSVTVTTPTGVQSGLVTILYTLKDPESDLASIQVEYSTNGSTWYSAAEGAGSDGTSGLATSPGGVSHTFVWNSSANLPDVDEDYVWVQITASDARQGMTRTTGDFPVYNSSIPPNPVNFVNSQVPSLAVPNDSDDFLFRGGAAAGARIYYTISGLPQVNEAKLRIFDSLDNLVRQISLPNAQGTFLVTWDGQDDSGQWVDEHSFRAEITVKSIVNSQIETYVTPTPLLLTDVSWQYRPMIFTHDTEFSPPCQVEVMLDHHTLKEYKTALPDPTIGTNVALSLLMSLYNDEAYYLDLDNSYRKTSAYSATPTVYIAGSKYGSYIFLQYWMFYPSSTLPLNALDGDAGTKSTWHEGDWEMFMVVLKVDAGNVVPHSATASQHYYGQTLKWSGTGGEIGGEDYVQKFGDNPLIFVAGGSHATYFAERNFYCPVNLTDLKPGDLDESITYNTNVVPGLPKLADIVVPVSASPPALSYQLLPLSQNVAYWRGRWGDLSWSFDGPPGPAYRTTGNSTGGPILLYSDPKGWHNHFVKSDQGGTAIP